MAHRLQLRGYPSVVINMLMAELTEAGVLDDRQFAKLWAHARARVARGSRSIAQELLSRAIPRPFVTEALTELGRTYDERAAARALVERRLARYRHEPPAVQWRRLSAQLARRGFPTEIIEDVLQQCLKRS